MLKKEYTELPEREVGWQLNQGLMGPCPAQDQICGFRNMSLSFLIRLNSRNWLTFTKLMWAWSVSRKSQIHIYNESKKFCVVKQGWVCVFVYVCKHWIGWFVPSLFVGKSINYNLRKLSTTPSKGHIILWVVLKMYQQILIIWPLFV